MSKRTYFTTVGGGVVAKAKAEDVQMKIQEAALACPGLKENFVIVPDFPGGTLVESFSMREMILDAWRRMGVPNGHLVPILAVNNFDSADKLKLAERFLRFQIDTHGAFKNILVVKGSSGVSRRIAMGDPAYDDMCALVETIQPRSLGLVINQYLPYDMLLAEIERKARLRAVRYFTQPMFSLAALDPKVLRLLFDLMVKREIRLTMGLMEASATIYAEQHMPTHSADRVAPSGRDRYVGMIRKADGNMDLSYIDALLALARFNPDSAGAFQTRHGLGVNAVPLLTRLQFSQFDVRTAHLFPHLVNPEEGQMFFPGTSVLMPRHF